MHGVGDVGFFDRLAPLYDIVMPAADDDALHAALARAKGPVDRLVDLGGGSGRATIAVDADERTVVDVSRGMLRRARTRQSAETGRRIRRGAAGGDARRVGPLDAIQGDAGQLPLGDDAVDAAIVVDAFHHMPDGPAVLAEARRVIRPGGVCVIREFDPGHPLGWLLARGEHAIGMDSTFHTPTSLAEMLATAGFEVSVLDGGFEYTVVGANH